MATKKAASSKKAAAEKPAAPKKQPTTKVTTVKAVEARPAYKAAAAASGKGLLGRLNNAPVLAALIAEFLGTFTLAAAIVGTAQNGPSAITALFALAAIVMTIGTLSGAHVNPALTVAAWVSRRMGALRALGYIVAQILGAMLALVLLNTYIHATGSTESATMMQPQLFKAPNITAGKEWYVFGSELIGTLIFGFAFAAGTRVLVERTTSGLTAGLAYFTALLIAGSLASMASATAILNPAVAITMQAFSYGNVWPVAIYGLASIVGAVIGFLLYDFLRSAEGKRA